MTTIGRGCSVADCERPHSGRGLCRMHYLRQYRGSSLGGPSARQYASPADALRNRVIVTETGCHLWQGHIGAGGYGRMGVSGATSSLAHRVAYELVNGPVPDGLELDHLCRVRSCVNPNHLEPVTRTTNVRRGLVSARNWNRAKETCKQGHLFSPENTYRYAKGRVCRTCHRERERARYHARTKQEGHDVIFGREPAAIAAFAAIAINLAITFGLRLSVEQVALINTLVVAGLGLIVRQVVTPTANPALNAGTTVEVITPAGQPNESVVL